MTRLLFLIKGLGRGGAERLLVDVTSLLDQSRLAVDVAYLLPRKDALVTELESAGARVHCLRDRTGIAGVWRLRSLIRERDIDLIHAHSPVAASLARLVVGRGIPFVYTEHNVWSRYRTPTRLANAATFGRNDHVFAVSQEVLASVRASRAGRRFQAIETLHHGVHPGFAARWEARDGIRGELRIPDASPLVVTVANFKPFKGHEHLLRAAAIVRERVPDVRFVLAGVGPRENEMKRLATELRLESSVVFAGFREDAPRLMAAADVFVLPSEREGLPIALLEAMALGRPVVATDVGGTPEVIGDAESGILIRPREPVALAAQIEALLRDDALRMRMGSSARRRAADFDLRRAVERMEDVYEELLA